ncbi:MAG: type II secretion system protein, partial [Phycisphaerae bacterium]|nr:type II secretion system protein [Phycisphaerae bacterium]
MVSLRHNSGVTLVEMLVVLGIIMVLSGIVITLTARVDNQSKENSLRSAFALVDSALREYYEAKGQFPPQPETDLASTNALAHIELVVQELRSVPASRQLLDKLDPALVRREGGTADVQSLCDPWGTVMDYVYVPGNNFPELISAGPDKQFGLNRSDPLAQD